MPFKSKAQVRWMYANKPKMAKEWEDKTKSIKSLPEKVNKKAWDKYRKKKKKNNK